MKKIALKLIDFYRKHLSKLKRNSCCPYIPTCSQYAYEAIEVYGFFKGGIMALYRILRCNPFSKGGFDAVPPKKK